MFITVEENRMRWSGGVYVVAVVLHSVMNIVLMYCSIEGISTEEVVTKSGWSWSWSWS